MGVYIKGFIPTDGLYQIKDGVIWEYKAKGGKVEPYELVEVKEPHGRLKDEREMLKFLEEEGGDGIAYDAVVNSPTIIGESERNNEPIEEAEELGKRLSDESEEYKRAREVIRGFLELVEATKEE